MADLIVSIELPTNIALFGSWGSGKSSFAQLLRGCLEAREPRVGLVVYDAWTFEGESLQRNFISACSHSTGADGRSRPLLVRFDLVVELFCDAEQSCGR